MNGARLLVVAAGRMPAWRLVLPMFMSLYVLAVVTTQEPGGYVAAQMHAALHAVAAAVSAVH